MPSIPRQSRHHGALRASVALACALCAATCADDTHRHREALTAPTAPTSATVPAPGSASGVSLGTAGGGRTAPAASAVLAVVSRPAIIAFPPRDESYDFRQRLETKYRDGLRRGLSSTSVDVEGAIVWTQEYLRYRVNACDDPTSRAAVWTQIRGGPPPPVCIAVAPEPEPGYVVMGHWNGTIAMPTPRPFTMDITSRRGDTYFGAYRDIAYGSASLTVDADGRVDFFVYFGDGSGTFAGRFVGADRVRGSMKYDKISGTRFDFEMVRN